MATAFQRRERYGMSGWYSLGLILVRDIYAYTANVISWTVRSVRNRVICGYVRGVVYP